MWQIISIVLITMGDESWQVGIPIYHLVSAVVLLYVLEVY